MHSNVEEPEINLDLSSCICHAHFLDFFGASNETFLWKSSRNALGGTFANWTGPVEPKEMIAQTRPERLSNVHTRQWLSARGLEFTLANAV